MEANGSLDFVVFGWFLRLGFPGLSLKGRQGNGNREMLLRHLLVPGRGLPDLANENTGNLLKFELQIDKDRMGQTY